MTTPGSLRTYLGTAPGVGKTYAMLVEGRRRARAGQRVVVGWIERHGREETQAQLGALEMIPPRSVEYRGRTFTDLDVAAVIDSGANLVLVDELAHTAADGSRRRWEDVTELVDAGLDVFTTANVANLESIRDYAAQLTGAGTVESVPDDVIREGEVILVDLPADVLRRRIASGKVYSADGVGGALAEYFRFSNLEALSALGTAWIEGTAEAVATDLLAARGLLDPASRPLVVAGVSESVWGERVIRRARKVAMADDADLLAVHVNVADGFVHRGRDALENYRDLTFELGGTTPRSTATHPPTSTSGPTAHGT